MRELRSERTLTQYWAEFRDLRNQYISALDSRDAQQNANLGVQYRRNIQLIGGAMEQISAIPPENYQDQAWQHFTWEDHVGVTEQQQEEREPDNDYDFGEETGRETY